MGEEETLAHMYCNPKSSQFAGDSTDRSMPTNFLPSSSSTCELEFQNVYYVPVEQRIFQDIRIEFLTTAGRLFPFEYGKTPTNVVLHFRKNYKC